MITTMDWWIWLAGGFVLLVAELVTPSGFFIMFFGIGAILTGVATSAGLLSGPVAQWFVFTAVSVASLLLFRGKIQSRVEPASRPAVDSLVGQIALPASDIEPGAVGRVMLRGASWEARNEGHTLLVANQRCRVKHVSGLQLGVVAE